MVIEDEMQIKCRWNEKLRNLREKKLQYPIKREAAKISVLSSGNIYKYVYLKEIQIIEHLLILL